jgi:hypothetical protein
MSGTTHVTSKGQKEVDDLMPPRGSGPNLRVSSGSRARRSEYKLTQGLVRGRHLEGDEGVAVEEAQLAGSQGLRLGAGRVQ